MGRMQECWWSKKKCPGFDCKDSQSGAVSGCESCLSVSYARLAYKQDEKVGILHVFNLRKPVHVIRLTAVQAQANKKNTKDDKSSSVRYPFLKEETWRGWGCSSLRSLGPPSSSCTVWAVPQLEVSAATLEKQVSHFFLTLMIGSVSSWIEYSC